MEKYQATVIFITHDVEEALFLSDRIFMLKNKPVTSIEVIQIPIHKERTLNDLHRPEMLELKERLLSTLRSEVSL